MPTKTTNTINAAITIRFLFESLVFFFDADKRFFLPKLVATQFQSIPVWSSFMFSRLWRTLSYSAAERSTRLSLIPTFERRPKQAYMIFLWFFNPSCQHLSLAMSSLLLDTLANTFKLHPCKNPIYQPGNHGSAKRKDSICDDNLPAHNS